MKDFIPVPRPVEAVLPPKATVMAESTALFPPNETLSAKGYSRIRKKTYSRCVLNQVCKTQQNSNTMDIPIIKLI